MRPLYERRRDFHQRGGGSALRKLSWSAR
jgi:hypothetical protein